MKDAADNQAMQGIRERAERLVEERFRYAGRGHPLLQILFELGLDHAIKEIAERPEEPSETSQAGQTPSGPRSHAAAAPLRPLELLVNEINLPALPQVLLELLRVINDPKSSASDVAAVIGLDTSLSSYLLRVVNSAYYSFPFPIDTIARAVVLIGTQELSLMAFSTSFFNMFKKSTSDYIDIEQFWKHSIACGIAARALAQRCAKRNPDRHFVAGLLHDIGRLALYSNIPELARDVLASARDKDILLHESEQMLLGFDHGRFGGSLLGKWNFPATLVAAVHYHHCPQSDSRYDEPATVHLADIVAKALGIGSSGESYVPKMDVEVVDNLKLAPEDLLPIIEGMEKELDVKFGILIELRDFESP